MAIKLVIVESPTKAKTIKRYLGQGYEVKASGGHVRDLPEDRFGVDVAKGFEPTYELLRRGRRTVSGLKKASERAEMVYLAPDPDREGEAIAWHLEQALGLPENKVLRATFHEITKGAVLEAFEHPRGLDMDLVSAQQARRILDRIVGYELSPLISRKIVKGLSAGRVQSVALRLVCEREEEVRAFKSEEYWTIAALLLHAGGDGKEAVEFQADLEKLDGEKIAISTEQEAERAVERLSGEQYRIESLKTRTVRSRAAAPFITSTLQQAAGSRMGFTADRTMRTAQRLYEGVEIDGESEGLITYMRTDSTRVADHAVAAVREMVEQKFGADYLPAKPNTFKSPRAAQAAHEAIRPTDVARTPGAVEQYLSAEQLKLYTLIWQRFVASQMAPALHEVTTARIKAGPGLLVAKGRRRLFDGYQRVMSAKDRDEEAQVLPALAEGELLELQRLVPEQHFTQPPPRYTEPTLVRELEKRGIGRPSTYAPTISTLLRRNYVRRLRRALHPTDLGMVVVRKLVQHFPREMDYDFTRDLEEKLDRIEGGKADWRATLDEFYQAFSSDLEKARADMTAVVDDAAPDQQERTCEKCGRQMVVRFSRKGDRFLSCSGFPECDFALSLDNGGGESGELTEHKCPKCGAQMLQRAGRRGRPYLACSAYPNCRNIMGLDKDGKPVEMEPRASSSLKCPKCRASMFVHEGDGGPIFKCPRCSAKLEPVTVEQALQMTAEIPADRIDPCEKCGRPMLLRRGAKGFFLGCENYPECDGTRNLTKDEMPPPTPTLEKCRKCGRPMVMRWGRYGRFLACAGFPKCRNTWQMSKSMPPCPRPGCNGHLIRKLSEDDQEYYGCTLWPACDHTTTEAPAKKKAVKKKAVKKKAVKRKAPKKKAAKKKA